MDLWKYCTADQCREMLLSFGLLGDTGWPEEKIMACLYALSNHAEKHYEQVQIPKKGGGSRTLFVPDNLLKKVQKNILRHILDGRSLPYSASAYHKGASTVSGAAVHTAKPLVLKLDIEDFFGSITFPMVLKSAFPSQYFPPSVGVLLTSLCCRRDCLPQGAPTSPAISNLVMRPFDEYMECWCGERGITYTRYCDDMTFSGDFDPEPVKRKVYGYLRAMGFEPNKKKTRALCQGKRQVVTGIVVNQKTQVPLHYRRALRQELYYCRKFGVEEHLKRTGALQEYPDGQDKNIRYLLSLLGKVHYVLSANPEDSWFLEARTNVTEILRREMEKRAE